MSVDEQSSEVVREVIVVEQEDPDKIPFESETGTENDEIYSAVSESTHNFIQAGNRRKVSVQGKSECCLLV